MIARTARSPFPARLSTDALPPLPANIEAGLKQVEAELDRRQAVIDRLGQKVFRAYLVGLLGGVAIAAWVAVLAGYLW